MRQLIAGNWKMNGSLAMAAGLADALRAAAGGLACDLLVCPPATLVQAVAQGLAGSGVAVGGQDCHAKGSGAHTGDIAAAMLREVGATHVILGHSERRADHGETDAAVLAKVHAAVAAGLVPVVCVGETEAQRVAGEQNAVVGKQLAGSLPDGFQGVVAYEPVWAIGTGVTATSAQAQDAHAFVRSVLVELYGAETAAKIRIQYGGSVKPNNAAELMGCPDIDGALIGGASLEPQSFLDIIVNGTKVQGS